MIQFLYFNILTKLYHYGIRGKNAFLIFFFFCNLCPSSKARARIVSIVIK